MFKCRHISYRDRFLNTSHGNTGEKSKYDDKSEDPTVAYFLKQQGDERCAGKRGNGHEPPGELQFLYKGYSLPEKLGFWSCQKDANEKNSGPKEEYFVFYF